MPVTLPYADFVSGQTIRSSQVDANFAMLAATVPLNVKSKGAVGDGAADDTAAIQSAIDEVKAAGGGRIYFPEGTYKITAALYLEQVRDIWMYGDGRFSTMIQQVTANTPTVQCNGLWYSRIEGLRFSTAAAQVGNAVFECDGNYDGVHTLGVQANTFKDCLFEGNGIVDYAFAMVRRGGGAGQGSENRFINCHFNGATQACYLQGGLNALHNVFDGGDMQAFTKDGARIAGSAHFNAMAFESTSAYTQLANNGFDINIASGVGDRCVISGVRSESLAFCKATFSHAVEIVGFTHMPAIGVRAVQAYALNAVVTGFTAAGNLKLYRVTTAGTTAGAEPVWPESGTVADGTVVWTQVEYNVIDIARGSVVGAQVYLGRISGTSKTTIASVAFYRKDAFAGYRLTQDAPVVINCYYEATLAAAITPISYGSEAAHSKIGALNLGEAALVAVSGDSGASYRAIALERGHGNGTFDVLNWWRFHGGIQHDTFTFAEMAFATAANGVVQGCEVFVSDGSPTDPLTGGGTGCKAYFSNGRWKGI